MSLVPYDSSDDESTESSSSESEESRKADDSQNRKVLPSALNVLSESRGEVFHNHYKAAETAEIARLEKHVKMVKTNENMKTINGVKICWNYRKGRCRFGSACTFAHSDIQKAEDALDETNDSQSTKQGKVGEAVANATERNQQKPALSNKKRPGLGNSLIPSKRRVITSNNFKSKN